jgi:hypothetical protein
MRRGRICRDCSMSTGPNHHNGCFGAPFPKRTLDRVAEGLRMTGMPE